MNVWEVAFHQKQIKNNCTKYIIGQMAESRCVSVQHTGPKCARDLVEGCSSLILANCEVISCKPIPARQSFFKTCLIERERM